MKWLSHFFLASPIPMVSILAMLCIPACDHTPQSFKKPNMTALSTRLHPLFEKTKTVCFSHFIIEVPATATVVYGPAWIDSPIEYYPGEADKLAHYVEKQLIDVVADGKYLDAADTMKFSMYGRTVDGALPGQKLVFGSRDQATYSIDSFIPLGKDLFIQRADGVVRKDDEINALNSFATNLRHRAENEVPSEPGTCIDGGFVSWQPEFEKVTVGIRLQEFPDIHFSIEVRKNQDFLPPQSGLESRLKAAEADGGSWHSSVVYFRRGPRQIGDWKGAEALALKPAQEDVKASHEFHFISLGAINAPLQPELDVQLDTGADGRHMGKVKPSLTNEEAVALWDKLTSSIRVRPLESKKTNAASSSKTPLKSLVRTGATCSQTGWWQCTEGDNIEGGKRRHFTAGETMPHAVLLGEPRLWQKLTGEPSRHTTAAIWQLVEYDVAAEVAAPPAPQNDHLPNTDPMGS